MKIVNLKSNLNYNNNNTTTTLLNKKASNNTIYPSTKEWNNSIYAYNKNNIKHIPVLDNITIKLITEYFNMYNLIEEKKIKLRNISNRKRKVLGNKVWVSKTELKHFNDKVVINLYVYNRRNNYILRKFDKNINNLFINKIRKIKKLSVNKNRNLFFSVMNLYLNKMNLFKSGSNEINKDNIINNNVYKYLIKNIYINFLKKILTKELFILYYKQYILYNTFKYKNTFILPLKKLITKIFSKKIVFNIVNIKNYFLNSDIFTNIVAVKAKNRNNKIVKILRTSLEQIKTPLYSKNLIEREKKKLELEDNLFLKNRMELKLNNDNINNIINNMYEKQTNTNVDKYIYSSLKNKVVSGIRLEASGRLTKRFTAQRSVFKYKYKGTIKNIDTSYKGLSSKTLRNNLKSNLQYTKLRSNNRIGAFGIKGWISSM